MLANETLDDLIITSTDDIALKDFNPDHVIDLRMVERKITQA